MVLLLRYSCRIEMVLGLTHDARGARVLANLPIARQAAHHAELDHLLELFPALLADLTVDATFLLLVLDSWLVVVVRQLHVWKGSMGARPRIHRATLASTGSALLR